MNFQKQNIMKTLHTFFFALLFSTISVAQSPAYQRAMGEALGQMGAAESPDDLLAAANTFERISAQAPDQYLPNYYAALSLINRSFMLSTADEKDQSLNRALELVEKAEKIAPGNSELETLRGYAFMGKLTIDPASRGQQFSALTYQSFGKAIAMDSNNPRPAALMARMELGTAQYFGSDTSKPCGMAQKAIALYEAEKATGFDPSWGRDLADQVAEGCK